MSLIVDQHREYLSDPYRLGAFRAAIREVVRPGMVVADIGSGTGILGLFALEAGAARVYSIEATGMIEIARAIALANGFGARFHPVQRHSSGTLLPELVDLFVSDFVGRFGFDAGIFEVYPEAASRMLRPEGLLLPSRVSMFVAPVERRDLHEQVTFWNAPCVGFDVSAAFPWAANTGYPVTLDADDLLTEPAEVVNASTRDALTPAPRADVEVRATRDGTVHGLGGWGTAQLSPSVTMTNSPLSPERIGRRNVFLPLSRPFDVRRGEILRIRFSVRSADHMISWRVDVPARPDAGDAQTHSTLKGMLLSRDDLRRAHPQFVPSLTPRGQGRLTVLALCDGTRPLRDVEDLVFTRHPDLFTSRGEAAAFVAEVVSGYTKL